MGILLRAQLLSGSFTCSTRSSTTSIYLCAAPPRSSPAASPAVEEEMEVDHPRIWLPARHGARDRIVVERRRQPGPARQGCCAPQRDRQGRRASARAHARVRTPRSSVRSRAGSSAVAQPPPSLRVSKISRTQTGPLHRRCVVRAAAVRSTSRFPSNTGSLVVPEPGPCVVGTLSKLIHRAKTYKQLVAEQRIRKSRTDAGPRDGGEP